MPENPRGWLATVAARRRIELLRADTARARREQAVAALEPPDPAPALGADDTLTLLMLCCHPALTRPSQVALTLRAVGGLRTAEIARAFLVPEVHHRAADQPGQGADQGRAGPGSATRRPRSGPSGSPRCSRCST